MGYLNDFDRNNLPVDYMIQNCGNPSIGKDVALNEVMSCPRVLSVHSSNKMAMPVVNSMLTNTGYIQPLSEPSVP